jgi:hypothetical protein
MRKPSVATILAFIALFLAATGTAVAGRHYLISSTNQIKPSVLAAIRGQLVIVRGPLETVPPSSVGASIARCPPGYVIVSGGYSAITEEGSYVNQNEAVGVQSWWAGVSTRLSSQTAHVSATAICLN